MAQTKEQKEAAEAAKRAIERESEPDEHKTVRRIVRETLEEWAEENLASEDDAKKTAGGAGGKAVGFLESILKPKAS